MALKKILFVDRDGTLIVEPPDGQIDRLEKLELVKDVMPALLRLRDEGYRFVMITNQDGLGTRKYPRKAFELVQGALLKLFSSQGIVFDAVLVCPHLDRDRCECRKPALGLVRDYLSAADLDRERSAVAGDRDADVNLARGMGLRGFRIDKEGWLGLAARLAGAPRRGRSERKTKETSIRAEVDLDTRGRLEVKTGIGFFDHMLEQLAKHGGFSLTLRAEGDLEVDEHHTVEDSALCLGEALRRALGDKIGIGRYGFLLPMDESQAKVSLDLSGRSLFSFKGAIPRESVGGLHTEMVPHFFRSLAGALEATLHVEVTGDNAHHMVEAAFKGVGRALRAAALKSGGAELPSTKGTP